MPDTHEGRSSEEIRRTIELTRADMHETVDALERKLSPGQIVDELWERFREKPGSSLSSMGSAMGGVVREHPVPTALMGLGIAWLAVERATNGPDETRQLSRGGAPTTDWSSTGASHRASDSGTGSKAEGVKDAAAEAARSAGNVVSSAGEKVSSAARSARSAARSARKKARSAGEKARVAGGKASDVGSSLGEKASRAGRSVSDRIDGEGARERVRQARDDMRSTFEEQPLAMGAAAFGLGLAGGLVMPSSRHEDEMMGDAADTVKRQAGEAAMDAAESAKEMATDTVQSAGGERPGE